MGLRVSCHTEGALCVALPCEGRATGVRVWGGGGVPWASEIRQLLLLPSHAWRPCGMGRGGDHCPTGSEGRECRGATSHPRGQREVGMGRHGLFGGEVLRSPGSCCACLRHPRGLGQPQMEGAKCACEELYAEWSSSSP